MGDVVHAAPLVSELRQHQPEATIDWLVEESFAGIARLHPAVTRVIPVALRRWRKTLTQAQTWREIRALRQTLKVGDYQHVIDCQGLIKSAGLARWARGSGTSICGFDRHSAREPLAACFYDQRVTVPRRLHAIERNRRVGAAALGYEVSGAPRFGLQVAQAQTPSNATAVLLTNASRATKLWPDAHWQVVERALAEQGLGSVLFWGSADEHADTQRRARAMQRATVAERCDLQQLAARLAQARVVVGLDTGLTHLAAALGIPTVGVFCDYDPALVGITGDAPCISLGGAEGGPTPEAVVTAIEQVMNPA